jgi:radical SAM protein with 4Fe4S-binding SPASM domain
MSEQVLDPTQTREFFKLMHKTRSRVNRFKLNQPRTEIAMQRALQFLECNEQPYHCSAGDTLVTIMSNGDLYPCRRMPIKVGNVLETPLLNLYNESELFKQLRNPKKICLGCSSCVHLDLFRGGLRCLTYAVNSDPFTADPGCWLAENVNGKK